MKVAQFIDSYYPVFDGVTIGVDSITRCLNQKGVSTFVVTCGHKEASIIKDYQVLRSKFLSHPYNKTYKWPIPMFDFKLKKILKNEKIDIIHTHSPFMIGHLGLKIAKKKGIPIISTFHTKLYDDLLESTNSKIITKIGMRYILNFYNKCDYILTVSQHAKNTLRKYGYEGKVKVFPNGVALTKPQDYERKIRAIKSEYQINDNEDVLLYIGMHNFKKNIKLIYEALTIYYQQNPNFKMIMIGTGNHVKAIEKLGQDLGIDQNIIYTGKIADQDKKTCFCMMADLMVFPSTYDTFSIVTREAAFGETPSVVVKDSGPAEGIVHGVNGFLCDETAESLAKEIAEALKDKKKLTKIGKEAARTLPISWPVIVDQIHDFYKKILQ